MSTRFTRLYFLIFIVLPSPVFAQNQKAFAALPENSTMDAPAQLDDFPPSSILKKLKSNFRNIKPSMGENEVFNTLGLARFKNRLKSNSFIWLDGAGGNWRVLLDEHRGYSIAFKDFMGHGNAKCMIKIPNQQFWMDANTSIPSITTKEMQENMNRQLKILRNRQTQQKEPVEVK